LDSQLKLANKSQESLENIFLFLGRIVNPKKNA
jgi:hypothetical protein